MRLLRVVVMLSGRGSGCRIESTRRGTMLLQLPASPASRFHRGSGIPGDDVAGVLDRRHGPGSRCAVQLHRPAKPLAQRSEEHTSELQSLMRISYAVFCLKKKKTKTQRKHRRP